MFCHQERGGQFAGISYTGNSTIAITSAGDVYLRYAIPMCSYDGPLWSCPYHPATGLCSTCDRWNYMGNVLGGNVPAAGTSWSKVKEGYRK